jgi:hypothetical protein
VDAFYVTTADGKPIPSDMRVSIEVELTSA